MLYPKLFIVGAGPGDPELLTIKAFKVIQRADVILYDALSSQDILNYARPEAKKIYVGKRAGQPSFSQERINDLIAHSCKSYHTVVRLKGGDPFVFGRGFEELQHAQNRGIRVEVVPGISSSIAAAGSMNIPITLRNVSRSFWVLTGTNSKDQMSRDIMLASKSSATLVIMMGLRKLESLSSIMRTHMDPMTPIAVIWNATKANSEMMLSTLDDVLRDIEHQDLLLEGPATIVVGEVVRMAYPEHYKMVDRNKLLLTKVAI